MHYMNGMGEYVTGSKTPEFVTGEKTPEYITGSNVPEWVTTSKVPGLDVSAGTQAGTPGAYQRDERPLPARQVVRVPAPTAEPRSRGLLWWVGGTALVLAGGAIAWSVFGNGNGGSEGG